MENSQTWQSKGNVTFDDTVFSGSNGENLTLSSDLADSSGITFTFAEDVNNALENTTGNEVTLIQDFAGTVKMDGVFYHTSLELQQGTFLLGDNDLVEGSNSNPTNLIFSDDGTGTFSTDGYDATFNGSMTLSATGTMDLGAGDSVITFEEGRTNDATYRFTIDNWSGDNWSGGGTDQLIFGTTLSADFLANVYWSHLPAYNLGARQLASGEILPLIPEPSTYAGIGFLIGFIFWREGKRRMAENSDLL